MAESNKKVVKDDAAKIKKLQSDLDRMKQVAKKLLTQKKSQESTIKKMKEENKTNQESINDLQSKLEQSNTIQSQLEDAIEKKNTFITTLEQKISHKNEAVALQTSTTQQILQELNNKCAHYEEEISTLKTEKEEAQQSNEELLKRIQSFEEQNDSTQHDEIASIKQKMADLSQELNSKQSIIEKLQTENEEIAKYKTKYETLHSAHSVLQNEIQTMKQSMGNREEIDEKDAERAKTLKSKMETMTSMMNSIQNGNQTKITELEEKLAVSLERIEEMTRDHEIQIKQYKSSKQSLVDENKMVNAKYDRLKDTLQEEELRSASLMELNQALKQNVMNLHSEKDELEDAMEEMQEKYMEFTQNIQSLSSQDAAQLMQQQQPQTVAIDVNTEKNKKLLDLHSKTVGFKESIQGLKNDMTSIAAGFQEQLISSTKGLAALHKNEMIQKQKYVQTIETLTKEKEDIMTQYEQYRNDVEQTQLQMTKELERIKIENEQIQQKNDEFISSEQSHSSLGDKLKEEIIIIREEKKEIHALYTTLAADYKDVEQHLHDLQTEYESYKVQSAQMKEKLESEYNEKLSAKEKLFNKNLNKVLEQNEQLKVQIAGANEQITTKHKDEINVITHEKDKWLKKYNDLYKIHEETHNELGSKKNQIEELLCDNQNMQDQIVKIKENVTNTDTGSAQLINSPSSKPIGSKRSQTPINKGSKSMDFDQEIHKQLKDSNIALENELCSINEQYQKAVLEIQAHVQKKEELNTKYSALTDECEQLRQKEGAWNKERDELQKKMKDVNDKYQGLELKLKEYETKQGQLTEDITRLTKEKEAATTKVTKLSHNFKAAVLKLKQFKASMKKYEDEKNEIQTKYDELMTEYKTLDKKLVNKVNELQEKVGDTKDVNLKCNEMEQKYNKMVDVNKSLKHKLKQLNEIKNKHQTEAKRLAEQLKNIQKSTKELTESKTNANDRYNALKEEYNKTKENMNAINELNTKNDIEIKRLQQELHTAKQSESSKQTKLIQLTQDHASSVEKNQILQMEHTQMKEQNTKCKQDTAQMEQTIEAMKKQQKEDIDRIKHKYKAYITKQKKEANVVSNKLTHNAQKLEVLQSIEQKHNELQQKHEELTKEYESKAIMTNEYETQTSEKYERLKEEFDTAQIQRNDIQKRCQTLSNEYEVMKSDLEQANNDKISAEKKVNELEKAHKETFAKYKEKAKHVVNKHRANAEKQVTEIQGKLTTITEEKEAIDAQYKALVTQHEQIANNLQSIQQEKESLQAQLTSLNTEITQHKQTKHAFEESISDLNAKLRTNQNEMDKLSKQVIELQETNNDLETKMQNMLLTEQAIKEQLESKTQISAKREQTLNAISASLAECSFFKSNDSMSIIEGVNKLAENYEHITIKHSETESSATDAELKLKEREDKIKRLAITMRKLQTVRKQLQASLDSTKQKLNQTVTKSEQYHKALQTINTEIQRSLDKWKAFMNETAETSALNSPQTETNITTINETDQEYLKRCLADVRSLSMYFIQSLDMFRENREQHQGATSEMEQNLIEAKQKIDTFQTELEQATKRIESTDNSQIAKNAHIEKLTEKLNHSIACIQDNWHHAITKIDFVDLSVSTRLVLEDRIWCLIRWRHKIPEVTIAPSTPQADNTNITTAKCVDDAKDGTTKETDTKPETPSNTTPTAKKKKYNDEYFWTSQATYLKKLHVKENEIYLPDFFENKLENQITKSLESKWKAIQRRTERQIQELKTQKVEEEEAKKATNDSFKQYKAKAKVILQKQKDELNQTQELIKELEPFREEVNKLKQQLTSLSTENWAEKYEEIVKKLSTQKSDLQNKKLDLAEIQSKLLLKERELSIIGEEFEKEKEELRSEFESQKIIAKKKFAAKLDDYRKRAREMLQEKDKQLSVARNRLKNARNGAMSPSPDVNIVNNYDYAIKYDKETQTEYVYDEYNNDEYQEEEYVQQYEQHQYVENGEQEENETVNNHHVITSTDDLVAALQPPLNATIDDKEKNKKAKKRENEEDKDIDEVMSNTNIVMMARMQTQRDHKIREFQERLRRLQELLNKSEQEHKRKDSELNYLKIKAEQMEQAQDVKKSADNSEYLKNALLQYFDGKINANQLVSVASVGLRFNEEEQKKAKNSKLIYQQAGGLGGYVKSWWA